MIQLTTDMRSDPKVALGALWIGDSDDEQATIILKHNHIGAVLNVANDLRSTQSCEVGLEVAQVGLIDGPGNEPIMYCAAVLALRALLRKHNTLVFCHTGRRSAAVAIMYHAVCHNGGWPGDWEPTWDGWLKVLEKQAVARLPAPHYAHKLAFEGMKRRVVAALIKD